MMNRINAFTAIALFLLCSEFLLAQSTIKVLSVDEMFKLAAENSKQLKLSNAGIATARTATDVAKNSLLPSIGTSLSVSYIGDGFITDRNFSHLTNAPMPHFGNDFALEASQVIYGGRTISNQIEIAKLNEQIAQLNFNKEQLNVRFLLIGYYLELYKLMNQQEVYIKNKEQINILIEQIKAKQKEGMALGSDITRHELMLQNIEFALIEIDNNCKIINNQLVTTLGLSDSTSIRPDTSILSLDLIRREQNDLLKDALGNVPELKTADLNIQIADKNVNMAKANYLPSISLFAGDYFNGPILIEVPPINKNYNYWTAGIGLKYNLSSLYAAKHTVSQAKATQDLANSARDVIEEKTELAVKSALIKYNESFDHLKTIEKSYALARQNYELIQNRYLNNMVLITEMLDAGNSKLDAELKVVNARINIIYNYYNLKYTSGTL
ncbi:MAG: TolC family protein [Bacteroidota bacterium]|nr:TolC family protein [Bacteroidota bacterium]